MYIDEVCFLFFGKVLAGGFYLRIDSVQPHDAGNYSCLAEGENGCTAQRYARLLVDIETNEEGIPNFRVTVDVGLLTHVTGSYLLT